MQNEIQKEKLGMLTLIAGIADRLLDGGLAYRFMGKAGAFVAWEKIPSWSEAKKHVVVESLDGLQNAFSVLAYQLWYPCSC